MDFTPKLATRRFGAATRVDIIPHLCATFRTPRPWTFSFEAGLLARGSQHPFSPSRSSRFSDFLEQMLATYSCGGSSGIAAPIMKSRSPYSRLSFQFVRIRRTSNTIYSSEVDIFVNNYVSRPPDSPTDGGGWPCVKAVTRFQDQPSTEGYLAWHAAHATRRCGLNDPDRTHNRDSA